VADGLQKESQMLLTCHIESSRLRNSVTGIYGQIQMLTIDVEHIPQPMAAQAIQ
jgi:hypothetical protein